ncbi:MAG: SagB/ThcOx family dehydrogenase [Desulfosarcina sp.]|nr:SagB/ThcOx family dehydrogenase [Desulfosarcina sp.]MBC2742837.1 SagB/ThcOx family dehydrogenase [Desulfosarcina sp.]MBC2765747.1 SagB/ThcOx family dehydrogenase [Desulfosarcina sp.]
MVFKKERRKVLTRLANGVAAFWLASSSPLRWAVAKDNKQNQGAVMKLPQPKTEGTVSVERAIKQRRTIRVYDPQVLHLDQLSQLLWSAQGITGRNGFKRAAPSAGALYPMDVYTVVGQDSVEQIEAGVYHYESKGHMLSQVTKQDLRDRFARAALLQMWMAKAPVNLVITAEYSRVTGKYGKRGVRYALIEAGHIGQNLFLQAEALGLKAGIVGAFHDKELVEIMKLPRSHEPLLVMPIGYAV